MGFHFQGFALNLKDGGRSTPLALVSRIILKWLSGIPSVPVVRGLRFMLQRVVGCDPTCPSSGSAGVPRDVET